MSSFNLDDVTKALEGTKLNTVDQNGISFEGKNLKLDTAHDAESVVNAIRACHHLEYLNLAGNTLGVEASEALAEVLGEHPELKRALWKDLFTGRLKDEIPKSLNFLGEGLIKANARLTELDLSDNAFGPIGIKGLANLLSSPSCYSLRELRLNNNGLGISGGKLLASALLDCYKLSKIENTPLALKVFIAGRNRLENEGAVALAQVFKTLGTLEEISMPQNGIYHVGISALSDAFAVNPDLKVLNLNDNILGIEGSMSLAKALLNVQQLESLNLGDCLLKTKGALCIAAALDGETHCRLEELLLDSNEIGSEGAVALGKAMANKPALKLLMLDENQLGKQGRSALKKVLGENTTAARALASLDGDESDNDRDDNSDGDSVEDESEEEDLPDNDEDVNIDEEETKSLATVEEFLQLSTAERFLALNDDRVNLLLREADARASDGKDTPTEVYIGRYVTILMRVCSLAASNQTEVTEAAIECTRKMLAHLFRWAQDFKCCSLLNNSLLVHLGLIKSEDKKFKPLWNLDGCLLAMETVLQQDPHSFPQSTKDSLQLFMDRRRDASIILGTHGVL